jgi:hypothetical protein
MLHGICFNSPVARTGEEVIDFSDDMVRGGAEKSLATT